MISYVQNQYRIIKMLIIALLCATVLLTSRKTAACEMNARGLSLRSPGFLHVAQDFDFLHVAVVDETVNDDLVGDLVDENSADRLVDELVGQAVEVRQAWLRGFLTTTGTLTLAGTPGGAESQRGRSREVYARARAVDALTRWFFRISSTKPV